MTRAVLSGMVGRGYGRIINVTSVTGPLVSNVGSSAYSAAKGGMDGMMRSVATEVGGSGVTFNGVAPGWIDTASSTEDERMAGKFTPVGRPGTAAETAAAVSFLATPDSSYMVWKRAAFVLIFLSVS